MSLRKERVHKWGISNIDYRSKCDEESLQLFQPWKKKIDFGTMGNSNYKKSYSSHKEIFSVTEGINTQKNIAADAPDPRFYTAAQFYKNNKIDLNIKTIYTTERVGQWEEAYKGKDVYTGDSMMIGDITKLRKRKKQKKNYDKLEKEKRDYLYSQIIKDKSVKNKEAIQETQLVKLDIENTLENKVDINKWKEIRWALRRRYANRSNFRKIFKEWDRGTSGEISVYDANFMINQWSIPINYNETRALIASSNKRNKESLNIEEFIHLIFNDNPTWNVDLSKLKYKEEHWYNEQKADNLKVRWLDNIKDMNKTDEMNTLKAYLRLHIAKLNRLILENGIPGGYCDYKTFESIIHKFNFLSKYTKEPILRAIYDSYKNETNNLLDCNKLSKHLIDNQEMEYFSITKEIFMDNTQNKIHKKTNELIKNINSNESGFKRNKLKLIDLDQQIQFKNEWNRKREVEEKKYLTEINGTVPSAGFTEKVWGKYKDNADKHNKYEWEFAPHPAMIKNFNQTKTRFSANPKFRKTSEILFTDDHLCPGYSDEQNRFNVKGDNWNDFVYKDKQKAKERACSNMNRRREWIQMSKTNNYWRNYWDQEKDDFSQIGRTTRQYNYEKVIKWKNEIIE